MDYIVVTGASTGIGLAIAQFFIEKGAFVFGSVRQEADAQRLKAQLGERFEPLRFDVRDEAAIKTAVTQVEQKVGDQGIALLVNNAGVVVSGPMKHLQTSELEMQFDINVIGAHSVTREFLPLLGADIKTNILRKGMVINISSVSAYVSTPFSGPYCASKIALEYLTDALRRELSIYPIRVALIQPGPIKTPLWAKVKTGLQGYSDTDYAPALDNAGTMINRIEDKSMDVSAIAALVGKVFNSAKPKSRYIIGYNSVMLKITVMLPTLWLDHILTKGMKKKILG